MESLLPEGGQFLEGSHHAADFVDALADLVRAEVLLRDEGLADLVDGLEVVIADRQLVLLSAMLAHQQIDAHQIVTQIWGAKGRR